MQNSVLRYPHILFFQKSSIAVQHVPKAEVKRIALGVSRSNGIRLQPHINFNPIVWTDNIQTSALRFVIPSSEIERLTTHCDGERPFDDTVLQIFLGIILSRKRIGHHLKLSHSWTSLSQSLTSILMEQEIYLRLWMRRLIVCSTRAVPTVEMRELLSNYHLPDDVTEAEKLKIRLQELYTIDFPETKPWNKFNELTERWVRTNAGNGLGMLLKEVVAELSGTPAPSVGYTFSFDDEDNLTVTIFDDDAAGNGCVDLAANISIFLENREIKFVHHVPQLRYYQIIVHGLA